jgi:hypothetical protein
MAFDTDDWPASRPGRFTLRNLIGGSEPQVQLGHLGKKNTASFPRTQPNAVYRLWNAQHSRNNYWATPYLIRIIKFYTSPSSSICGAGGNPAYRTSAFEAVCTLTLVLIPPFISRGAPHQTAWETSISERKNYGREMACQIYQTIRLPRNCWVLLTCRKSATCDRRLYFPSEGRHSEDFFPPKKSDGFGRVWTREASMLTTRPPKPLNFVLTKVSNKG